MNDIKNLLAASGMTQQAFADYLAVPKRTVENWVSSSPQSRRTCPDYVVALIRYKLINEGLIKEDAEVKKEYKLDITPTAGGDLYTVEVLHDGKYVAEMREFFNHMYRGKGTNRKVVMNSRKRAEAYIAELEGRGYTLCEAQLKERF